MVIQGLWTKMYRGGDWSVNQDLFVMRLKLAQALIHNSCSRYNKISRAAAAEGVRMEEISRFLKQKEYNHFGRVEVPTGRSFTKSDPKRTA